MHADNRRSFIALVVVVLIAGALRQSARIESYKRIMKAIDQFENHIYGTLGTSDTC